METMKNKLSVQSNGRGGGSIFKRYKGSANASVANSDIQNISGARRNCFRTSLHSNIAAKRFSAAKWACKNGRYKRTNASRNAPSQPTSTAPPVGRAVPNESSAMGTTNQ